MTIKTINVTGWSPGTIPHIKQVLASKHRRKEIIIQYKLGGEVGYLVSDK